MKTVHIDTRETMLAIDRIYHRYATSEARINAIADVVHMDNTILIAERDQLRARVAELETQNRLLLAEVNFARLAAGDNE